MFKKKIKKQTLKTFNPDRISLKSVTGLVHSFGLSAHNSVQFRSVQMLRCVQFFVTP